MRPTLVKDAENLQRLAEELKKDGATTIDMADGSVEVYRDGKKTKVLKVGNGA